MTTPKEILKVAIIQPTLKIHDIDDNLKHLDDLIKGMKKTVDLIVLPEMFNTAFTSTPQGISEDVNDSKTRRWMQKHAQEKNCAIAGSFLVTENGKYYNRLHFVYPDTHYVTYDKKHLYTMGNESDYITPGNKRVVCEYLGWKFNLAICYDLRFPAWLRNTKDNRYDCLLLVNGWSSEKVNHMISLVTARAIENQAYVICCNNCGLLPDSSPNKPNCIYTGDCRIVNYFGKDECSAICGVEQIIYGNLVYEDLQEWRNEFPVLNDQDDYILTSQQQQQ